MILDTIYNEDCLAGMQRIPDGSVDAVICDLPYGVLNRSNPDAQWDKPLPLEPLWAQLLRVTKESGAICLFGQGMFTARLMMSQPKIWRYNLVWDKMRTSGHLNANRLPLRCHEDIAVFYRKQPTYHPQMTIGKPSHPHGKGEHKQTNSCYGRHAIGRDSEQCTRRPEEKFPTSIICIPKEHEAVVYHPTQKAVDLIRWLIRTYTDEGGVILDPCMGSGSTALAALREKRHYVGFEISQKYFSAAQERIHKEIKLYTL